MLLIITMIRAEISEKYRVNFLSAQQTKLQLGLSLLMAIATYVYVLRIENATVRSFMMILPALWLFAAILFIFISIPTLNYRQVDETGMHVTTLWLFHKNIK